MIQHALLFGLISWIASLVYHALRNDDVLAAVRAGTRRFLSFFVLAIVVSVGLLYFTRWL